MAEQFVLRWNDFHANLSTGFHNLLENEDLCDVTLAADGKHLRAHKIILSVCSPYFKELFKSNPCQHPIVILKDVEHTILRQLLDFMYRGEVNVKQQDFTSFLRAAELLQVKGLTVSAEKDSSIPPAATEENFHSILTDPSWALNDENDINFAAEQEKKSPLKRLLTHTYNSHKKKKKAVSADPVPVNDFGDYMFDGDQTGESESMSNSMLDLSENTGKGNENIKTEGNFNWNAKVGGVKCPSCHRYFANRYNLKVHIRDKHETTEGTIQCEVCEKHMRNQSCLRVHMYHHRKQAQTLANQIATNTSTGTNEEEWSENNVTN